MLQTQQIFQTFRKICLLFLIPVVFVLLPGSCAAQQGSVKKEYKVKSKKALQLFEKGLQNDKWRDRKTAVSFYKQALELEPNFAEANFRCGFDLYIDQEYEEALPYMIKAREGWYSFNPSVTFYLGELYFYNHQYDKALENYQQFFTDKPPVQKKVLELAQRNSRHAAFAKEAIKTPIKFEPLNMGENINSDGSEYFPCLTADDGILFLTGRREESTGGYQAELRGFGEDFFFTSQKEGKWQSLTNLGSPVNTEQNEGAACFSPDGQYVYFTACNREDGFGSCDIYVSKLNGRNWDAPRNLGPLVNSSAWDSQPWLSNDGKTLYYASNRNGGLGLYDIWFSEKVNGAWGPAQNLGAPINTLGAEYSPFLHADGQTLYFSSDEHPGFGGVDLFMSKLRQGGWGKPINLGYPLNTSADERNIFINTKGDKGYINSDRKGGYGQYDIYEFELDPRIKPNFTTFVRGFVLDSITKAPLDATVSFINLATRDTIREVQTNSSTGRFLLSLPLDQEYAAFVDAKGYLFSSENFSLKGLQGEKDQFFDLMIQLRPIRKGARMVLENIFYETAKFNLLDESKAELDHLVDFMKVNSGISIEIGGHTDDIGSATDNLVLSENRAGEVKKYLINSGITERRITAKGYGEDSPIANNGTDEGRAKNRRTEIRIIGL